VPRARMANGWALGKFGGEFGQGTDVPDRPDDVRYRRKTGSGLATANMTRLTRNGLLLPARYTTLADFFLTPSVEQLSRYAAVS